MPLKIDIRESPCRLAEIIAQAGAGFEVIVTDGNMPRARLVPLRAPPARVPGLHAGVIQTAPDFDAPLPDEFWAGSARI